MSNRVWFTGDQHWNHPKMMWPDYSNRPFITVEAMNEAMIQGWIDRVHPGDRVYHVGDVAWGGFDEIVDRLPGQLFLVCGNHDHSTKKVMKHPRWIWTREGAYLKIDGQRIHLSHYPFESWRSSHFGSWHLHGHSHGNMKPRGRRMDVGVDTHPFYAPWSLEEVAIIMEPRTFEQVDHHREREG